MEAIITNIIPNTIVEIPAINPNPEPVHQQSNLLSLTILMIGRIIKILVPWLGSLLYGVAD
jgi:hypothetical protein